MEKFGRQIVNFGCQLIPYDFMHYFACNIKDTIEELEQLETARVRLIKL